MQSSVSISTCGNSGEAGPDYMSCVASMLAPPYSYSWAYDTSIFTFATPAGGIGLWQRFIVQASGTYSIAAAGAAGISFNVNSACRGAVVTIPSIYLPYGTSLFILVGQMSRGVYGPGEYGGGGGTFVIFANSSAIVVAGGGGVGFGGTYNSLCDASLTSTAGNSGLSNSGTNPGGVNGGGGSNSGGAGLIGDAQPAGGARAALGLGTGAYGGGATFPRSGGYGGGGTAIGGGGGAGGYSGGGGGSIVGGGGGSFCLPGLPQCSTAYNSGTGYVNISLLNVSLE
jgi:hypothetical protein